MRKGCRCQLCPSRNACLKFYYLEKKIPELEAELKKAKTIAMREYAYHHNTNYVKAEKEIAKELKDAPKEADKP